MDYSEDTNNKIPFYMTYPMQNLYLTEMEYEKDMERMKDLYPKEVKQILPQIEDRCDELEFEGSRIFDEEPDRLMMEQEVRQLYEKISGKQPETLKMGERQDAGMMPNGVPVSEAPMRGMEVAKSPFALFPPEGFLLPEEPSEGRTSDGQKQPPLAAQSKESCDGWLCSMIGVLFSDEVYRRRCRRRRCRRWW